MFLKNTTQSYTGPSRTSIFKTLVLILKQQTVKNAAFILDKGPILLGNALSSGR